MQDSGNINKKALQRWLGEKIMELWMSFRKGGDKEFRYINVNFTLQGFTQILRYPNDAVLVIFLEEQEVSPKTQVVGVETNLHVNPQPIGRKISREINQGSCKKCQPCTNFGYERNRPKMSKNNSSVNIWKLPKPAERRHSDLYQMKRLVH